MLQYCILVGLLTTLPRGLMFDGTLVIGQLGAEGIYIHALFKVSHTTLTCMLAFFKVSHTTPCHVLISYAHGIRLSPTPGASMQTLPPLLEIPPGLPCSPVLRLCGEEGQNDVQLPLLPNVQVLMDGHAQEVSLCLF